MSRPANRRLTALLLGSTILAGLAAPVAAVGGAEFVDLANQRRTSVGKTTVALSAAADQVSIERADAMAKNDAFVHDTAYIEGRLRGLGACFTSFGEIIAWESGYPSYDPARTVTHWWNSPGHKSIMVGDYNAAGGSHTKSARSGKTYSVMIFVKLCPDASPGIPVDRLAGGDRYATAAAISRNRFSAGAGTVFVATGEDFPDALTGSPAAARARGPILLTRGDDLPASTANELSRLQPSKIVILGGTGAVSERVAASLAAYAATVVRWSGSDRYDTAATVSRSSFAPGVGVAYVATGGAFPDALAGGPVAGSGGSPILLVQGDTVPRATADELVRLRPSRIVILGGPGVVNDAVANALRRYATSGTVARLNGADRYGTSVMVSRSAFGAAGSDVAFVATGRNFPDGLAGGPVAALVPGPLLLVSDALPSSVADELDRLSPDRVYVLGGPGIVSDAVVSRIRSAVD